MKDSIRILHLEDNPSDAALVRSSLMHGGVACAITRVDNEADFLAALIGKKVDLILADYQLPTFDGLSALKLSRQISPDIPLILISGTLGEERAIESLHSGATDYVLKDRLSRLVPAVRRALKEAEDRLARKEAEEQFVQAQKMEAIGLLAGSVAHDFNNILSVILGYDEVVLSALGPGHPSRGDVEEIKHAAERAVGLTRQLHSFSRKQEFQPVALDLNQVVAGMDNILKRLLDENIELTVIQGTDLGTVEADSGYIGQILMNLVINARDAMPEGGKLVIQTSHTTLREESVEPTALFPAGDYVLLSVSDSGTGMTDEVKARLFEPFFTTKPKSKGTGLGLATCQTIARQFGGHIKVQSQVGQGATLQVYLPRSQQPAAKDTMSAPGPLMPRGTETLMLVEDEPSVRHLAVTVLRSLGYEVLSASNGQDGLQAARGHKGAPLQLVITDVIMPRMGGKVMAEWLKPTFPDLKILFTSGYTDVAMAYQGSQDEAVAFLEKPYTPSSLARKVRTMLDAG